MYKSIDELPVYLFNKISTTGNLSLLRKGSLKVSQKELEKTWAKIYNEFLKEFGLSDKFKQWMDKQRQIIEHYFKAYVNGERHQLNFARIKEIEAEKLINEGAISFEKLVAMVSKFMGRRINTKEETVSEFYNYIKLMEDGRNNSGN